MSDDEMPTSATRWLDRLLTPALVWIFLSLLVIEIVSLLMGAAWPIPPAVVQNLTTVYTNATQTVSSTMASGSPLSPFIIWAFIALHNGVIILYELLPLLGVYLVIHITFVTGQILHAVVLSGANFPMVNAVLVAATLMLFPHSTLEFSGYALAGAAPLYLIYALIRRKTKGAEVLKTFLVAVAASIGLIFMAAGIETLTEYSVFVAGLLWFPVMYVIFRLRRRYLRNEEFK